MSTVARQIKSVIKLTSIQVKPDMLFPPLFDWLVGLVPTAALSNIYAKARRQTNFWMAVEFVAKSLKS